MGLILIKKNDTLFIIILSVVLVVTGILSIGIGSTFIPPERVIGAFIDNLSGGTLTNDVLIVLKIRLPRILLAAIAGGILAISGLIYQTVLKNPLSEPFTLGVSSGAVLGAAVSVFISDFFVGYRLPYFPFALAGTLIVVMIIFFVSQRAGINLFSLLFIGISLSLICNALITLFFSILGNRSYDVIMWSFGTFSNPQSGQVLAGAVVILVILFAVLFVEARTLDVMYLSDELIKTSGVNINFKRGFFFLITSIGTAYIVSYCGIIGFVGLIVPHIARLLFSGRHRILLPASFLIGATLLLISDDLSRTVVVLFTNYGGELPIGVVTSLIGAPVFIYLILRRGRV